MEEFEEPGGGQRAENRVSFEANSPHGCERTRRGVHARIQMRSGQVARAKRGGHNDGQLAWDLVPEH